MTKKSQNLVKIYSIILIILKLTKLLHPVHGIDKMSFQTFFCFYRFSLFAACTNRFLGSISIILYMFEAFYKLKVAHNNSILQLYFIIAVFFNLQYIKSYQYFIIVMYLMKQFRIENGMCIWSTLGCQINESTRLSFQHFFHPT